MELKKILILISFVFILSISKFDIYASDISEKQSKSNIIYVVNGKKMLEDREIFIQDRKIYIQSEDLEELLNMKIHLVENTISIEDISEIEETKEKNIFLESAIVVDVDIPGKMIKVLPYSESKEKEAYITLEIDEETKILHEAIDKYVPLSVLEKNMFISIKYDTTQTIDGQKQYRGKEITIKRDKEVKEQEGSIITDLEIIEINTVRGYIKVAYNNTDKYKQENQIIIHIDQNTNIKNTLGESLQIKDLSIEQQIDVLTNGILTASIPPQTVGLEIIIK